MSDTGGYALRRNGSCLSTETDCGGTTPPFHACCPGNMFCPGRQYNVVCCPSNAGCRDIMSDSCADKKADLYSSNTSDLANEGFCCERDSYAFAMKANSGVGCAADLQTSMDQLMAISSASGTYLRLALVRCESIADICLMRYSYPHAKFNSVYFCNLIADNDKHYPILNDNHRRSKTSFIDQYRGYCRWHCWGCGWRSNFNCACVVPFTPPKQTAPGEQRSRYASPSYKPDPTALPAIK